MKRIVLGVCLAACAALVWWIATDHGAVTAPSDPTIPPIDRTAVTQTVSPTVTPSGGIAGPEASPTEGVRTPVVPDVTHDWIVRGTVRMSAQDPHPGARISARCIAGHDETGATLEETELVCDDRGRFAWPMAAPTGGVFLRVAGAMPGHGNSPETVRVPFGDPPPQDIELYVYPLDLTIEGVVTDLAGTPLPGASVRTYSERVECEADGSYEIAVTRAFSQMQLTVSAAGHVGERRVLSPGDETSERVDFRLREGFRIEGRVVDEAGAPIAEATVMTFFTSRDPTHTDVAGRFVLDVLDPDREQHSLVARAAGYVEATESVDVKAPKALYELVLRRGARVRGRVLAPDGRPVAGAELYIGFDPNAWNRLDAISQDDGSFMFPAVPSGAQTLVTQRRGLAPDERVIQIDAAAHEVEVIVQLQAAHFVAGIAVDEAGAPAGDVPIGVRVASDAGGRGKYIDAHGRTAADGHFRLEGLPAGNVVLEFYGSGWLRADFRVAQVDREDLRVELKRAAKIAGRVVDALTSEPVTAFRIRMVRSAGGIAATWVREGRSFRNAEGLWDTGGEQLEAGTEWGVEAIADGYAPTRVMGVVAAHAPDPDGCVLRLVRGGIVEGVVMSRGTGLPIEGATITWFADARDLGAARREPYGLLRARTDSTGRFELAGLPPGETKLAIEATDLPQHIEGPFELRSTERVYRRVTLGEGARIHGVVVDVDGLPSVTKLHLSPREVPGAEFQKLETGGDGRFEFRALIAGQYELFGYLLRDGVTTPVTRLVTLDPDQDLELQLTPEGSSTVRGTLGGEFSVEDGSSIMLMPTGTVAASGRAWRGAVFGGRFELRGIPGGEYRAVISTAGGGMGSAAVKVDEGGTVDVVVDVVARPRRR